LKGDAIAGVPGFEGTGEGLEVPLDIVVVVIEFVLV
jgi:hypothetical protein